MVGGIRTSRAVLGLLLSVVAAIPAGAVARPAAARAATVVYDGRIGRTQVMLRALDWLRRDVPYSQDNRLAAWDAGHGRRYRPDCSGFVAMAWALDPRRPGLGRAPVTWELPRYAGRVSWPRLRRGDILLHLVPGNRAAEHVRLFAGWVDAGRSRAWIIEQSGSAYGMRRRTVATAAARQGYVPYRYRRIV
ncbi:hypothetical protein Asp14428_16120 [Actinoplanes sp. NBRC 14428]|uniref:NlpC/P60 family protein n=1 Tax=Pseudosporangium ferrugineum TaxID=439699 RepID=A0A2T0SAZ0_9ACTN|nr:hypothetical protein [Pseudosporangium ferrugineum]PRY30595.1 hypothetical protein CLV70_104147 [Pseudosporangium ferrugineum]BCJ50137.1 hypothetical protein Asp14428_16120 [Actinoplanes sp. NBRC 14428]